MSGITGLASVKAPLQDFSFPSELLRLGSKLSHRGPDSEGLLLVSAEGELANLATPRTRPQEVQKLGLASADKAQGNWQIGLGHQTLITWLPDPQAHQPLGVAEGQVWASLDGEIYNAADLRTELSKLGASFRTEADAEVVAWAWVQWGESFVNRLEGNWALLVYDRQKQVLFGSRDRFGVKPLYYLWNEHTLVLASEAKALYDFPGFEYKINRGAAFEYVVTGVLDKDQYTLVQGINEMPPGNSMTLSLATGIFKFWPYYALGYQPDYETFSEEKFRKYAQKVRRVLSRGVEARAYHGGDIAHAVSGGLDSSALACMTKKVYEDHAYEQGEKQPEMNLFTLVNQKNKKQDGRLAEEVAQKIGANWNAVEINDPEFVAQLENLVYQMDWPVLSTSAFSHYKLLKEVRSKGFRIVMDGQGADFLFAGYDRHFRMFMRELVNQGAWVPFLSNFLVSNNSFASKGNMLAHAFAALKGKFLTKYTGRPIKKDTYREFSYLRDEFWSRYSKRSIVNKPGSLNTMLWQEFTGHALKTHLRVIDRAASLAGVEARLPYADDHHLVEYIFKLSSVYKVRHGLSKIMLRAAVGDNLPNKVLWRRDKSRMVSPHIQWMRDNKELVKSYFDRHTRDIIDVKRINADFDRLVQSNDREAQERLWRLVNLAIWRKVYNI